MHILKVNPPPTPEHSLKDFVYMHYYDRHLSRDNMHHLLPADKANKNLFQSKLTLLKGKSGNSEKPHKITTTSAT